MFCGMKFYIAFPLQYAAKIHINYEKWVLLQHQNSFHLHNFHLNCKKKNDAVKHAIMMISFNKNRQLRSMNSVKNCKEKYAL